MRHVLCADQTYFNDMIKIQALLVIYGNVHETRTVKNNIGQDASVFPLFFRDHQDLFANPLPQKQALFSVTRHNPPPPSLIPNLGLASLNTVRYQAFRSNMSVYV